MSCFDLNTISPAELQQQLAQSHTLVACLCAEWCDVCTAYRTAFEGLAAEHPEYFFLWIDVEDQAELVGDFEVENFPTLLIQQHGVVTFYGTMQPDTQQLKRLLRSQAGQSVETLQAAVNKHSEVDLLQRLNLMVPPLKP